MTKYAFINGAIKKCVTNCNKTTFEYVSRHEDKCVPSCADEGSKIKQGTNECIEKCDDTFSIYNPKTNECV